MESDIKPTCSRPHISLCIPAPVIGYRRNTYGGGGEGMKRKREEEGKIGVGVYFTTTTSTTGEDETQGATVAGAKIHPPMMKRNFLTHLFICMCSIRTPPDPAGVMVAGVPASGISSLKAHGGCQR